MIIAGAILLALLILGYVFAIGFSIGMTFERQRGKDLLRRTEPYRTTIRK
jgi:hypothetical protein